MIKLKNGNAMEFMTTYEGEKYVVTISNTTNTFKFLGNDYSYFILSSAKKIKTYSNTAHEKVFLTIDLYGRLFLTTYKEEMSSESGDRMDETYCLVADEKDADELFKSGSAILGREPYVYSDCCNHIMVREKCKSNDEVI
ncbi:hypothetical protein [Cellulosilyticum sp. I15G10I2]|uniref:hypothetical protein n=1 Tax=Cellulosilyticum sp. I15G10I2 TaxID=1892843 RepID=UPI00085BD454|nr:hypothetical protein [Cellulosilyticum sp. I15G10I2]